MSAMRQPQLLLPASLGSSRWTRSSTYAPTRLGYEAMSQHPGESILKVQELAFGYGAKLLQRDVSFDVKRGSIFAIMGASGSGKSTLLKTLIGLLRPSAGEILFGGENYRRLDDDRRAQIGRRFGVLFRGG